MCPCRARSQPAPPSCRSPFAYPSRPPPARSESLPASRSSQQLDDLSKRPRRDLATNAYPRAAAELNLDEPSSLHSPARSAALRLRHDLDRHHRAALSHRRRLLRQYLPPPFEQLV